MLGAHGRSFRRLNARQSLPIAALVNDVVRGDGRVRNTRSCDQGCRSECLHGLCCAGRNLVGRRCESRLGSCRGELVGRGWVGRGCRLLDRFGGFGWRERHDCKFFAARFGRGSDRRRLVGTRLRCGGWLERRCCDFGRRGRRLVRLVPPTTE